MKYSYTRLRKPIIVIVFFSALLLEFSPVYSNDALRDQVLADPKSVENGELRFAQTCAAYCHGDRGSAGEIKLQCQPEYDADYLFAVITEGRRNMPAWADAFDEKERWELAAFILSLKDLPHCNQ
jgi:mono/diheme cytochrome c family protein